MVANVVSGVGPRAEQHRGAAGPQREGHGVAEPVGEEQLCRGEVDIVRADAERVDGVALAGHHHVAVAVDAALGCTGRSRRVEPECRIVRCRRRRFQRIRRGGEAGREAATAAFGRQCVRRPVRSLRQCGLALAGEFRRPHDAGGARVLDDEAVVGAAQQGIERDRHEPRLDRAPEQIEEHGAVLDHHQHAIAGREPEA